VFPTTLDTQGQLSQVKYGLDTTCSSLGALAAFGARVYDWSNTIKKGERAPELKKNKLSELADTGKDLPATPVVSLTQSIIDELKARADALPVSLHSLAREQHPTPLPMQRWDCCLHVALQSQVGGCATYAWAMHVVWQLITLSCASSFTGHSASPYWTAHAAHTRLDILLVCVVCSSCGGQLTMCRQKRVCVA
jgi:hypothetical protein